MSRRGRSEVSAPLIGAPAPGEELGKLTPTVGIEEAAQLLRVCECALMRKARVGKVSGAKIGRPIRTLRTANPFEKSASQLARQRRRCA